MRVHELGPTIPTRKDAGFESGHGENPKDLVAGDTRAIETPGLASLHSLFLNEHNRISRVLKEKSPDLVDEELYQMAPGKTHGKSTNSEEPYQGENWEVFCQQKYFW